MAWPLCLPVGQASSLASSSRSSFFGPPGLRRLFQRGTSGSKPSASSEGSATNSTRWAGKSRKPARQRRAGRAGKEGPAGVGLGEVLKFDLGSELDDALGRDLEVV